jgi:hypothetical protein
MVHHGDTMKLFFRPEVVVGIPGESVDGETIQSVCVEYMVG